MLLGMNNKIGNTILIAGLLTISTPLIVSGQVAPASVAATIESACSINVNWTGSVPDLAYYQIEFAKNAVNFETQ